MVGKILMSTGDDELVSSFFRFFSLWLACSLSRIVQMRSHWMFCRVWNMIFDIIKYHRAHSHSDFFRSYIAKWRNLFSRCAVLQAMCFVVFFFSFSMLLSQCCLCSHLTFDAMDTPCSAYSRSNCFFFVLRPHFALPDEIALISRDFIILHKIMSKEFLPHPELISVIYILCGNQF